MPPPARLLVHRHGLVTRTTHWINLAALIVLLLSGLQIFNAHPALYWGEVSTFARPWVAMFAAERGGEAVGITKIGSTYVETTGVLGFSGNEVRGFPAWATLPSYRSLADGRRWHFFFAWVLAISLTLYMLWTAIGGHLAKDLHVRRREWSPRHIWRDVKDHARLRFPRGAAAARYNILQKLSYIGVIFVLLPLMIATGLAMRGFD